MQSPHIFILDIACKSYKKRNLPYGTILHQRRIALCLKFINIKPCCGLWGYDDLSQSSPCSCESVVTVTVGPGADTGGGGGGGGSEHCNI